MGVTERIHTLKKETDLRGGMIMHKNKLIELIKKQIEKDSNKRNGRGNNPSHSGFQGSPRYDG